MEKTIQRLTRTILLLAVVAAALSASQMGRVLTTTKIASGCGISCATSSCDGECPFCIQMGGIPSCSDHP